MRPKEFDSIGRNDDRRQVMETNTEPRWCAFLERLQPTSLDREFVSIEFELAFAVNVRTALLHVEATPACRRFADIAIKTAVNYSCLRHSGKTGRVLADAHRAIDEALWRLMTELRNCKVRADACAALVHSTQITERRGATDGTLQRPSRMSVSAL
jgi:hypothetical protein